MVQSKGDGSDLLDQSQLWKLELAPADSLAQLLQDISKYRINNQDTNINVSSETNETYRTWRSWRFSVITDVSFNT